MNKNIIKIKSVLALIFLGLPGIVLAAQSTEPPDIPSAAINIGILYGKLIDLTKYMFGASLCLALIFMMWAGVTYMTAGGDDEKIAAAKKRVIWGCVGAAIIIGAWAMITIVPLFFGITPLPIIPR